MEDLGKNIFGIGEEDDFPEADGEETEGFSEDDVDVLVDDDPAHKSISEVLDLLLKARGAAADSDDDDDGDDMNPDRIHNRAVDFARRGQDREAARICMKGLERFPNNVDLLADAIEYSAESGDYAAAAANYAALKARVPYRLMNWRAFTFSFDYLLKTDPIGNEQECRELVSKYEEYLPYEERAYVAHAELEAALGNFDASTDILREAIRTHANASQCALKLADMQLERGLFEEVVATTNYGIAASADTQPSINIPYLCYVRALAKDHLLHRKVCQGAPITAEKIDEVREEYELLLSEFPNLHRFADTIHTRVKLLKFIRVA